MSRPSTVHADGTALDQFDPVAPGDRAFGVPSSDVRGEQRLRLALELDLAHDSLVLARNDAEVGAVVSDQLWLRALASFALADRYLFSLSLPMALVQSGDDPSDAGSGLAANSPSGVELGDLKLGARVRLLGARDHGLQLGLGLNLWLPTGASNSFVSDSYVRALPYLVLGAVADRLSWSTTLGVSIRDGKKLLGDAQTPVGTGLSFGAALGYLIDSARTLRIGPELYGQTVLTSGGSFFEQKSTNMEVLAGARYRIGGGDYELGLAAGPGIGLGAGTPAYRIVLSFGWVPEDREKLRDRDRDGIADEDDACPDLAGESSGDPTKNGCPADRDGDGVFDRDDACPDTAGPASSDRTKNGCPAPAPTDRDGDGIEDANDACPDAAGIKSDDPKKNGCPAPRDQDGDGISDDVDACPGVPGAPNDDPKKNGCPPDRDGDGIADTDDACPEVPGVAQPNPKWNGCPLASLVQEEHQIIITQQIQFETGNATIRPESDPILQDVRKVLAEHPEIGLLEVHGHTDTVGARGLNIRLSKQRAQSVMKWLIAQGIARSRLRAQGYGPDRPIADNATGEGRDKNRRVEFRIVRGPGSEKSK